MLLLFLVGAGAATRPSGHPGRKPVERPRRPVRRDVRDLEEDARLFEDEEILFLLAAQVGRRP